MKYKEEIIETLDDLQNGKILTTEVAYDKIFKIFRKLKNIKFPYKPRSKGNNVWKKIKEIK